MNITVDLIREMFHYCPISGVMLYNYTRGKVKIGDVVGTLLSNGYLRTMINGKSYYVHRLAFIHFYGRDARIIDHRNHDKLDNRITNLRECSRKENNRNVKRRSNNSSGFRGVYRFGRRWGIRLNNKWIGAFDCPVEAAREYDKVMIEHFGEFALTNKAMGLLE